MLWYADYFKQSAEEKLRWGITGLIHDFDYEKFPDCSSLDGHPYAGNKILSELGVDQDIRDAIMGHATYTGYARKTLLAKVLFAVDELSGLITACALVRPDKSIGSLTVQSVKKKFKDKAFARGCNRDDIILGAKELGIELEIHINNTIESLK
jgi:predicted hydrolase (HD superfamily)